MKIDVKHLDEGKAIVTIEGRVDAETAPDLKSRLKDLAQYRVMQAFVDVEDVDFIDSSGLSAMVSGLKALRKHGGTLILCGPQPQALKALRLTLLDRVFPIYPALEEALEQAAKHAR